MAECITADWVLLLHDVIRSIFVENIFWVILLCIVCVVCGSRSKVIDVRYDSAVRKFGVKTENKKGKR